MGKIPNLNECNPGFEPVEYKVVVAPAEAASVTKGGIFLPDDTKDMDGLAEVWGRLVAISPLAFNFDTWPENAPPRPKPGDQVLYGKYAGTLIKGDDGREYRLMHDKDICAVKRA
jgi:chaperonin GroES